MKKRMLAILLAAVLVCALAVSANAYDIGAVGEQNVLSCGGEHAAIVDENGFLWMWGNNSSGQLGNGTKTSAASPIKIMDHVVSVSCGIGFDSHTAAIKTDGSLWTWGANNEGQLGNGSKDSSSVPGKVLDNVAAVSCGGLFTAAIKKDGSLWVWGYLRSVEGQSVSDTFESNIPVKILDDVTMVSCGYEHIAAVKKDGTLWIWGHDGVTLGMKATPIKAMDNVKAVSCGAWSTTVIQNDNSLWVIGNLGNNLLHYPVFTKVMDDVVATNSGNGHSAAIKKDGSLWTWGWNWCGELGNGWVGDQKGGSPDGLVGVYPVQTTPLKIMDHVAMVRAGGEDEPAYTLIAKGDGSVWVCGFVDKRTVGAVASGNQTFSSKYESAPIQTVPAMIPGISVAPTAYASTQTVTVDGKKIEFQCYALKDAAGNDTNYIKLRDLADILNGSAAQFEVGWDGNVTITTKTAYTKNGSEQNTPFSGNRAYKEVTAQTMVNGKAADLAAFTLTDDAGGGYTYYKLRDLGAALGFKVDWTAERGIFIETK